MNQSQQMNEALGERQPKGPKTPIPNSKKFTWKVVFDTDKKTRDEIDKELQALFNKFIPKTNDGFIEVL